MDITRCGIFIAELRKKESMTQKQLADHLGVTDKAISRWETGKGLPDADSMLALSELFGVTINELLHGEREITLQTAEETLVDILHIADKEKKKHRRLRIVLATICSLLIASLLFLFGTLIINDIATGDGTTWSFVNATMQARTIARQIENGSYEKAVKAISFSERDDRRFAEKEWCVAMHELFDNKVEITSFTVDSLEEEDQFICGTAHLCVYASMTDEQFVFEIGVAEQDGIAFGRVVCVTGDETRGKELTQEIAAALCTYYAG